MKIAVLGATGRTGRLLVPELVRRGHSVSVLVRDPDRLPRTTPCASWWATVATPVRWPS